MTYSELVKEAIRKAHEEAKAAAEATKNQVAQFEVGKTYYTRSICNHDCIFSVKVIKKNRKDRCSLKGRRRKAVQNWAFLEWQGRNNYTVGRLLHVSGNWSIRHSSIITHKTGANAPAERKRA